VVKELYEQAVRLAGNVCRGIVTGYVINRYVVGPLMDQASGVLSGEASR